MKTMILLKWLAIQWEEVTSHLTVNNFGLSGMFKKDDKGLVESQTYIVFSNSKIGKLTARP